MENKSKKIINIQNNKKSKECECRLKILQNNYYDVNLVISRNFKKNKTPKFNLDMIAVYGLNQNGRNLGNF